MKRSLDRAPPRRNGAYMSLQTALLAIKDPQAYRFSMKTCPEHDFILGPQGIEGWGTHRRQTLGPAQYRGSYFNRSVWNGPYWRLPESPPRDFPKNRTTGDARNKRQYGEASSALSVSRKQAKSCSCDSSLCAPRLRSFHRAFRRLCRDVYCRSR